MAFDGIALGQTPEQPFVGKRSEASAAGAKYYLNPRRLCQRHPNGVRLVSNTACVECSKTYHRTNREAILSRKREYCEENKEAIRLSQAYKYQKNKEHYKEKAKENAEANRERKSKTDFIWRQENAEYLREYQRWYAQVNPDYRRTKAENRRSRKLSAPGKHTQADIADLYASQKGRCAYCKKRLTKGKYHVDHIIPLSSGGSNDKRNLQITCGPCNQSKGAKDPLTFARKLGKLL